MTGPCVYRYFDADGRLLYVGSTIDLKHREKQHARTSPWHARAVYLSFDVFGAIDDARAAERGVIVREEPIFNTMHTPLIGLVTRDAPPPRVPRGRMRQLSVALPDYLWEAIESRGNRLGISTADALRRMLDELLDRRER